MVARNGNVALINVTSMSGRAKDRQRIRVLEEPVKLCLVTSD